MASKVATSSRHLLDEPSTDAHLQLLTEHFGFNPRVFIDALVYAANEHLYTIAEQFHSFVSHELVKRHKKSKEMAELEAERGISVILTYLENALDHTFDSLELYCLKAVFGIRPSQAKYMTLSHHRGADLRTLSDRMQDGVVGALTAEEEEKELEKREWHLQQQIEKASKVRHALRLANASATQSLRRAEELNETFSILVTRKDGSVQLPSVLPQSARKLSLDASSLLKAMDLLIDTDSLGASLLSSRGTRRNDRERKRVIEESGASEQEKRDWEQGREQYINWEISRILKSVSQQRSSEVGNLSRVSISSGGIKRRKTDEQTRQLERIGNTAELETLAGRLRKR